MNAELWDTSQSVDELGNLATLRQPVCTELGPEAEDERTDVERIRQRKRWFGWITFALIAAPAALLIRWMPGMKAKWIKSPPQP